MIEVQHFVLHGLPFIVEFNDSLNEYASETKVDVLRAFWLSKVPLLLLIRTII